jgi:DNA repair ATPase RecN
MELKGKATNAVFKRTENELKSELEDLKEKLEEELDKLEVKMKELETKEKNAKDKGEEEKIKDEIESLKDLAESMKDELEDIEDQKKDDHEFDFEFAKGVLDVEAANNLEDWYKEFAELIEMKLPKSLRKFRSCFDEEPKVEVEVEPVEEEDILSLEGCD